MKRAPPDNAVVIGALQTHVEAARAHLAQTGKGSDDYIHAARKALKRARASLRLMRGVLGDAEFEALNASLRDAAVDLGQARDAIAFDDAFKRLARKHGTELGIDVAKKICFGLAIARAEKIKSFRADLASRQRNLERLADVDARVRAMPGLLKDVDVMGGLGRQFKKSTKTLRLAKKTKATPARHEWRKQMKYLYNAALDVKSDRKQADRAIGRGKRIADLLGDEHDLVQIEEWIINNQDLGLEGRELKRVRALFEQRRLELRDRVWHAARHFYARSGRHFARRTVA